MLKYYVCKYYLNATHSFDNDAEHAHAHTFTISFWIQQPEQEEYFSFYDIDKIIVSYVEKFSGKYLNEEPEFEALSPTLENIGDVMFEAVEKRLAEEHVTLLQVEICENPLRVYSVSNKILLVSEHANNSGKNWEKLLSRQKEIMLMAEKERNET